MTDTRPVPAPPVPAVHEANAARIGAELVRLDGGPNPFAAAVRATRMPMIVTDPRQADNPVVFANDSFCRLTGYARPEIIGRNCRFLQGPETDPATVARIREAVREARPIEIDIRNHRKGGEPFWNRLLMAPVRDEAGEVAYFFASQVDVTLERERVAGLESRNAALLAELNDRLRAQEESEARIARILAMTPAGIVEFDEQGRFAYANPAAEAVLGAQPGGLTGLRHDDAAWRPTGRDGLPIAAHALPAAWALRGEQVADYEQALNTLDGRRAVLLVDAVPIHGTDATGAPASPATGALAAFQDITARQQAVQALRASEERYRTLFEAIDAGFCIIEVQFDAAGQAVDYRFVETNPAFELQAGLTGATGRSMREMLPAHEQHWFDTYGRVATTRQPVRFENAAAGLGRWFDVQAFAVGDPHQHRVAVLFSDISARRRAELDLRASEARLRRLTETLEQQVAERTADRNRLWQLSTDAMVVARMDGVITAVNPAWTVVLGWAEAELVGRPLFGLIHPDDLAKTRAGVQSMAQGATLRHFENRYRHKDGSYRWITWAAVPGDGLINAVGRDTTAEKESQAALEQAQEALRQSHKMEAVGELTGGIAHDFNNMLQAISGGLEMAARRAEQGRVEDVGRYIDGARATVARAAALTHRLLSFARRQALQPRPVQPDRLIAGMAGLIRQTVGPGVAVELQMGEGIWPVLCDPNQLENVLLNLAINARDAMAEDGRLAFSARNTHLPEARLIGHDGSKPGDYVEIAVADTGIGMDAATRDRAFEPFFTTKPIGQGTGLGLSQAYGFVRQSNGLVWLDSAPGQGTTVRMFLPRHAPAPELAAEAPPRREQPDDAAAGEVVLLVEDEADVRAITAEHLRLLGYAVFEAASGPAALLALRNMARVDALVTDVGLPGGMNGRQVADAAREQRPGLPVLFITGYAGAVLEGQLAPGMAVIGKPFSLESLVAAVRGMCGR